MFVAESDEGADRRRCGVEDGDSPFRDQRPPAIRAGLRRNAFVQEHRRTVRERSVDDVRVAGDPSDVGRTPVDVFVLQIEDGVDVDRDVPSDSRPSCAGMPLGLPVVPLVWRMKSGCSESSFAGRTFGRDGGHHGVPPVVATGVRLDLLAGALHDDDALDVRQPSSASSTAAPARAACRAGHRRPR